MMPGAARAATMMAALTKVCHQRLTLANEMMLRTKPRITAPRTGPATPPTPPRSAVPPMTTAEIEVNVSASPMAALPELVSMVMAMPASAAMKPETT